MEEHQTSDRKRLDELEANKLALIYDDKTAQEVLKWGIETFHPKVAVSSSFQAEDMVLVDMAWRIKPDARIFTLDTGRLPQETYDLIDEVREKYRINIEIVFPKTAEVEEMVQKFGANLFYRDVKFRLLCCDIRKVRPLGRVLEGLDAWVTGLRREQSPTRAAIRKVEIDHDHGGIVKINPLAAWTRQEVWDYIKRNEVPVHKLYEKGYTSIGCAPCTRAIRPGEDERAGRWWWEKDAPKECGIHYNPVSSRFERELSPPLKDEKKQ